MLRVPEPAWSARLPIFTLTSAAFSEAEAAFKRAIDLDPHDAEVHLKLGETYVKMGDIAQAREQLRILDEADPDSAVKLGSIIATVPDTLSA